jgi:hypothetical protein
MYTELIAMRLNLMKRKENYANRLLSAAAEQKHFADYCIEVEIVKMTAYVSSHQYSAQVNEERQ